MWKYQEIFYFAFLIAFLMVPLLRRAAFALGILDHPKSHGIHAHPVPLLGGVALYAAFVLGSLYRMDLSEMLKGVLVGSSIIFLVGLVDDVIGLRAGLKLLIQLFACGIMMFRYGVILDVFPNELANGFFTVLGIIGITNAVNFLDNMDGLAAGLVMISSLAVFAVSYMTKQPWLGYLSVALAGACLGFLYFNLKRANVFMGDSGSTFLGFTVASLAVMAEWSKELTVTLAVPVLILGVPILDMILITVLRIKEGKVHNFKEWIDYTGKDHFSHRVMRLGLGKRGAVFALWGVQVLFCMVALLVVRQDRLAGILGLVFYGLVTLGTVLFFRKRRILILYFNRRPRKRQLIGAS